MPRALIPFKPDWKQSEINDPRKADYYESSRALGDLFRNVHLLDTPVPATHNQNGHAQHPVPLSDSISDALRPYIVRNLGDRALHHSVEDIKDMEHLFRRYLDDLKYICLTHSLSDLPDSRLAEEEVVIGTILANCTQHRYRTERMYRMRLHSSVLANDIRWQLYKRTENPPDGQIRYGLSQAWLAWDFGTRNKHVFGANSFALIALAAVAESLEDLGEVTLAGKGTQTTVVENE